jgi:AraC-like DNA-binding protein
MSASPFGRHQKIGLETTIARLHRVGLTYVASILEERLDQTADEDLAALEFLDRLLEDELRAGDEQLAPSRLAGQRIPTERPRVLWIDLRVGSDDRHLEEMLVPFCELFRETHLGLTASTITDVQPQVLVFDYDYPDLLRLRELAEIKTQFPSLPILMLVEQRSEGLAIWAFRTGVRDYLHSPVQAKELIPRIRVLSEFWERPRDTTRRLNVLASQAALTDSDCLAPAGRTSSSRRALAYVDGRLAERISLQDVAEHCGLGTFAFSRAFRKEVGITFQEYLARRRIDRAQQLLLNPLLSITEVAHGAGFGDLSHFNRTFRRYVGSSPSVYRKGIQNRRADLDADLHTLR